MPSTMQAMVRRILLRRRLASDAIMIVANRQEVKTIVNVEPLPIAKPVVNEVVPSVPTLAVGSLTIQAGNVTLEVGSLNQSVNLTPSFNMQPVINVRPTINVPEMQPANVDFRPNINVPQQATPQVVVGGPVVNLPDMKPTINLPETQVTVAAPVITVEAQPLQPRPKRSMEIVHDDGTKSTVTER